ncbi:MAG: phosphodiester glycosidase family protein [Muribaculaceae bacterium]|nr:phosphodiester glycosidase family protein [Muribaculaceae bacterium]
MKKIFTLMAVMALFGASAQADVTIDGKSYAVDTIIHRQVGPGMMHSIIRLPGWPMNVYITEMDATNPHARVEASFEGRVGRLQPIETAMEQKRTPTKRPVVMCNANFWVTTNSTTWAKYQLRHPLGGLVRNDTIVVNPTNEWEGGPQNSGTAMIDRNGHLYMGTVNYVTTVSHPGVNNGQQQYVANVNRRAVTGEMALFNECYSGGRQLENDWVGYDEKGDNQSDNYFLKFVDGEDWAMGQDMHFVVSKTIMGKDRTGYNMHYNAILTCTGWTKDLMSPVQVGDTLTIRCQWTYVDAQGNTVVPQVENLVEGNATVMTHGELTPRNYDESYNTSVYSRTAYGTNADGTRLYFIVIDKSLSPDYGRSNGATTAQMCQVLKGLCPEVTDVVNMDAGGSALMFVDGDYANTSTEYSARSVACGWMMCAMGEEDNEIASIAFADYQKKMPIYSSYRPVIWGYNARGEIVSHDVQGFTLSCDPQLGTCGDDTFFAGGNVMQDSLTATFGGMTARIKIITQEASPAIKLKPALVIDNRDYPVEVIATVAGETFFYEPSSLQWTIDDSRVAAINNGTLHGIANGQTKLSCLIGELNDSTTVRVEISDTPYKYEAWEGWTVKGSGHKNFSLVDNKLTYTYGSSRVPYIALDKNTTFYGLPDTIGFAFKSDVPIDRVQMDVRNYNFPKTNNQVTAPEGGFEAGVWHTVKVDIEALGGADKVGTYPIEIREVRFEPTKNLESVERSIEFTPIYCHYSSVHTLGDVTGDGSVDIDDVNAIINVMLGKVAPDRFPASPDINGSGSVDVDDLNLILNILLGIHKG